MRKLIYILSILLLASSLLYAQRETAVILTPYPASVSSAPTFVQFQYCEQNSATPACLISGSNVVSGHAIALEIDWQSTTVTLTSITANCVTGNFTLFNNPTADGDNMTRFAGALGIASSTASCTVTANLSGTADTRFHIHEIAGNAASPADGNAAKLNNSGTTPDGSAPTSGNLTTAVANDYLFCSDFDIGNVGDLATGAGFTTRMNGAVPGTFGGTEDKTVASPGTTSCNWTTGSVFRSTLAFGLAIHP